MGNANIELATALENVRTQAPLVHNITNYVTVNDCANILLACGGSPIMADDSAEVEEITSICRALVINIGTLNERTIDSMIKAGIKANELHHPVILDPVGAGASQLRTKTVFKLLAEVKFTVIRGNISEIKTVYEGSGSTKGVDANISDIVTNDNLNEVIMFARNLSERTGAVIVITGATDIVTNKYNSCIIRNGHPMMGRITGTGCMLSALIGAFCAANIQNPFNAAAAAVCMMGLAGELAFAKTEQYDAGTASFRLYLIDYISKINADRLRSGAKIETR